MAISTIAFNMWQGLQFVHIGIGNDEVQFGIRLHMCRVGRLGQDDCA